MIYILDEPSAGLHPADTEALLDALQALKKSGNSLFVVEHELDVIRRADWIVDVGPGPASMAGRFSTPDRLTACNTSTIQEPGDIFFLQRAQPIQRLESRKGGSNSLVLPATISTIST